jgi:hypothetical protein
MRKNPYIFVKSKKLSSSFKPINMKRLLLTSLFLLLVLPVFGQIVKCKANGVSLKTYNENSRKWSDWSKWEDTDILVLFDFTAGRIKVFSKEDQVYDIIQYYEPTYDKDGDKVTKWLCINDNGARCELRHVKLNSNGGKSQLYIDFADVMIVYNIYVLD